MTTEERLARVERELAATRWRNRWLLVGLALGLGALALVWASAATTPGAEAQGAVGGRTVRANEFIVEDENGKERARLGVYAGGPSLGLRDENGKTRAMLVLKADGPELSLRDAAGRDRVAFAVTAPGPWLCLYDAAGNGRASLGAGRTATPDGKVITHPESSLLFIGADGKVIWSAP